MGQPQLGNAVALYCHAVVLFFQLKGVTDPRDAFDVVVLRQADRLCSVSSCNPSSRLRSIHTFAPGVYRTTRRWHCSDVSFLFVAF